jgi:hypothetical protein
LCYQHCTEAPDLTGFSEREGMVLLKALAKDPRHRFPTCQAFLSALVTAAEDSVREGKSLPDESGPNSWPSTILGP